MGFIPHTFYYVFIIFPIIFLYLYFLHLMNFMKKIKLFYSYFFVFYVLHFVFCWLVATPLNLSVMLRLLPPKFKWWWWWRWLLACLHSTPYPRLSCYIRSQLQLPHKSVVPNLNTSGLAWPLFEKGLRLELISLSWIGKGPFHPLFLITDDSRDFTFLVICLISFLKQS